MKSDQQVVLIIEGKGLVEVLVGDLLALILVAAIMTATTSSTVSRLFLLLPVFKQLVRRVLLLCVVYDDDLFSIRSHLHHNQINLSPLIHPQNIL